MDALSELYRDMKKCIGEKVRERESIDYTVPNSEKDGDREREK